MSAILTVSELTRSVKGLLEAEFPFVWVRGQVTGLSRPASGHVYFSLTDEDAVLSVVWFRSAQKAGAAVERGGERVNPLTGEIEEIEGASGLGAAGLEDGMEVLCAGRINVYEPRGQYQLVAELVQEQGVSDLAVAFEALKRKLEDKGYFDEERKMAPPRDPRRVAVITSPTGAAVRDFLRIAQGRGTGSEIRIYPTLVQGDRAPAMIASALDAACDDDWAEVAVLIRGGGSLEDLWAFNTKPVADAIFRARVPVVCGVGHEPDVTIADFVADKRVATPSQAAQELWTNRETLAQSVDVLEMTLKGAYARLLMAKEELLEGLRRGLVWLSPARRLERLQDRFLALGRRLDAAGRNHALDRRDAALAWMDRLERAMGPAAVEATAERLGAAMRRLRGARPRVDELGARLGDSVGRLRGAGPRLAEQRAADLALVAARLGGLDPEGPLERGYSLVRVERTGQFLRSPDEVVAGEHLDIRVRDGRVPAVVMARDEK